jgi:hypothetical protein
MTAQLTPVDPWKEAVFKVEEDRKEPTGRQASVEVPAQLKHYRDRRRFLNIQVAEWRKQRIRTPHDFAELAELIRNGDLIELPPLGESFILYGVGFSASDEPFTHYDRATGKSVTLFGSDADLQNEHRQIADSLNQIDETIIKLRKSLSQTGRTERELRIQLRAEIIEHNKLATALKKRKDLLDSFYRTDASRQLLASEFTTLAQSAQSFSGRTYDLQDPASRKALKVHLLSFIRPAALKILEELARSYEQRFRRPLPITSLVRTDEYQRQLGEFNPNATRIEAPPHTTGLAFDIYYRFMATAEQNHVMSELARLRDEGRIEALRENRDHFHVFAFADGAPPKETLIRQSLGSASGQPQNNRTRISRKTR